MKTVDGLNIKAGESKSPDAGNYIILLHSFIKLEELAKGLVGK